MTPDPTFIRIDSRGLLRSPLLAEDQSLLGVIEISLAQLIDGDRFVIEFALFRRIVAMRDAAEQDARLHAGGVWRPDAMRADRNGGCPEPC